MTKRWHIMRDDTGLTLARHLPVRFDLAVQTAFPDCHALRLAQQVRQDMWRLLQNVRGFSPVVRIERHASGLFLTAGGRVPRSQRSAALQVRLSDLLEDPVRRARWLRWARVQGAT